ncbi:MAG TPA: dihydrofolate reductase family protein [Flavitalea sp.]|nr:dihydrofolate reductase family protein [Flavitalea sp.]
MAANQRKISVFNQISLDGYFTDASNDMSWAHKSDPETNAFAAKNASGEGPLLFGRVTYEMMAAFWPTPMAAQQMPEVAKGMNERPKLVVSRTLQDVSWNNSTLLKGDLLEEVRKLKAEPGEDITILGSGSIVAQLAGAGVIDDYHVVVNPIALGAGRTMFDGIPNRLNLRLTGTRTFGNGNVLLSYGAQH